MKHFGLSILMLLGLAFSAKAAGEEKVTSSAFSEGGNIPAKYTCDGSDASPPLQFGGFPAGAKSLVLIVDDPDAPGRLFTHWLVWNMDPKTNSIAEGAGPKGVQGKNDFGKSAYGGPCPPSGTHRYYFKVFALDKQLELPAGSGRRELDKAMKDHVIGQAQLMGRYSRQK